MWMGRKIRRRIRLTLLLGIIISCYSTGCASTYYHAARHAAENVERNTASLPDTSEASEKIDAVIEGIAQGIIDGIGDSTENIAGTVDKTIDYSGRLITETTKAISGGESDFKSIADDVAKDIEGEVKERATELSDAIKAISDYVASFDPVSVKNGLKLYGPFDVKRVVDGDTFIVSVEGTDYRIRLIGIDTPESVHEDPSRNTKEGKEASNFSKKLLEGQQVYLEFDAAETDTYGRTLAYAYLPDGRMVEDILLSEGQARTMTIQPNVKYADHFVTVQKKAAEELKGFWKESWK